MAGPWLRFRGHLDNISNNLLIGATNAFNDSVNSIKNKLTEKYDTVPNVARAYNNQNISTLIVGEENYGEGSSREHAAMEPRHMGIRAVLVKSFARIHETNLKKQGILALTFKDKDDYDKICEDDTFDILGLNSFSADKDLQIKVIHSNGNVDMINVSHTYNANQIDWFNAGSSLNLIAKRNG